MLLKMIGGFVLVRLLSWLLLMLPLTRRTNARTLLAHGLTFGLLVMLQVAVRAPLGAFSLGQPGVFLPGAVAWLIFDLAMRRPRKTAER